MDNLNEIAEKIHQVFESITRVRDQALIHSRKLTQHSAHAIRAIHREEKALAREHLDHAQTIFNDILSSLAAYPDLYYAGYTQDAIKEFVEASITCALIQAQSLPTPDELKVEYATYLNGLAETSGCLAPWLCG
jgi:translin